MKKIFLCIALLVVGTIFGQITKLSSLSSSKFLDSKIIYEDNNQDVFGYLLIFEKERTSKVETVFEVILLDKNLNKVGLTNFAQETDSYLLIKLEWSFYFAKKSKDSIYFAVVQAPAAAQSFIQGMLSDFGTTSFRTLDLKKFIVSDSYLIKDAGIQKQTEKFDMKSIKKMMEQAKMFNYAKITKNNGFVISDKNYLSVAMAPYNKPEREQFFNLYDLNFNKKWTYKYNDDSKSKTHFRYDYFMDNDKDIVFIKSLYTKQTFESSTYEFIDSETGKRKFEISLDDSSNNLVAENFQFQKDVVILFASVYDFNKKKSYSYDKKRGYVKLTFDRQTGKQLSKDFMLWDVFAGKLDIDESGEINKYGFIEFIDFKTLDDGNTIVIAEGYYPGKNTKILDLFTLVFDKKMKLLTFNKVDKFKNRIENVNAYGNDLYSMGAFDYMYSQNLAGGGFVFYYTDNEKNLFAGKRDPKWILGVVTYIDGVFSNQKVPLTSTEGDIYPIRAKNGYVLLKDVPKKGSNKDTELRLEKINY